jgi:hypothetical protein
MLENKKSVFESVTIWGVLVTLVGVVLNRFGIQLVDEGGWANDLVVLFGAVMSLYGRIRGTKRIKGLVAVVLLCAFSLASIQNAMAAPPDKWSRDHWKYAGKIKKVAVYNLVVPEDGLASGDTILGSGPDLPKNSIITKSYYHIATEFVGASDNVITLSCIAAGDIATGLELHGDAQFTVAAGSVDGGAATSYVKTTSAGCSPYFSIGAGVTGYTEGRAQFMVEFVQLNADEGLSQ